MSWMPSADPILGDKRSCDALELVIVPRGVIWAMALPCAAPCRMRRALPLSNVGFECPLLGTYRTTR